MKALNPFSSKSVHSRRDMLSLALGAAFSLPAFGLARAQDAIAQALEWSDGFDTAGSGVADVRTSVPIMSPEIVDAATQAIATYSDVVARGGWPVVPAVKKMRIGARGEPVRILRERLMISGDLAPAPGNPDTFDSYVDTAVRRFQARHGIPIDGVVGDSTLAAMNIPAAVRLNQLATNLTRLKMLTTKLPDRFVMVNIPAAQVEAVEQGSVVSRHTAIVGKIDRPSPIVNSKIYEVNFNPFWTVPESIIRKDLIPKVRANPNYLEEYHIKIYDQSGNQLTKEQIDWNTDEAAKLLFRQDPGDWNSLGTVRINFFTKEGVYMHDTPQKGLFNNEVRFDSSGCVRIQNVRELVVWLLRDTPEWSREQIDVAFRSGERLDAKLATQLRVFWAYVTAWSMPDGVVHFRNDIYGLDGLEQVAVSQDAVPVTPAGSNDAFGSPTALGPIDPNAPLPPN